MDARFSTSVFLKPDTYLIEWVKHYHPKCVEFFLEKAIEGWSIMICFNSAGLNCLKPRYRPAMRWIIATDERTKGYFDVLTKRRRHEFNSADSALYRIRSTPVTDSEIMDRIMRKKFHRRSAKRAAQEAAVTAPRDPGHDLLPMGIKQQNS